MSDAATTRTYGWDADGQHHELTMRWVPATGEEPYCRVFWRYGIASDAHDGCIGFRIVLAPAAAAPGR
jgi:hypothetical protein